LPFSLKGLGLLRGRVASVTVITTGKCENAHEKIIEDARSAVFE